MSEESGALPPPPHSNIRRQKARHHVLRVRERRSELFGASSFLRPGKRRAGHTQRHCVGARALKGSAEPLLRERRGGGRRSGAGCCCIVVLVQRAQGPARQLEWGWTRYQRARGCCWRGLLLLVTSCSSARCRRCRRPALPAIAVVRALAPPRPAASPAGGHGGRWSSVAGGVGARSEPHR